MLADEPEPWRAVFDPRVTTPRSATPRLHTPPRFSRKLTHAVRHAAARLFGDLGLRDVASVEGWVELPAGYVEGLMKPEDPPEGRLLYDEDPEIVNRVYEEEAARMAADPAPLEDYYDYGSSWHADLSQFDPPHRLLAARNGEGATVRFSAVSPDLPLEPTHPAVLAAAEVGMPHATLLRNLANNALRRAAEAGNPRALTPGVLYVSPEEAVAAAAGAAEVAAALQASEISPQELQAMAAEVEEEGEGEVEVEGEEEELAVEEEAEEEEEEEEQEEAEALEDDEGEQEEEDEEDEAEAAEAAGRQAAMLAAAAPVPVPPQPLQLAMPPQLPLYHTAVMQHWREGDEFDAWIETHDPDYWGDAEGPIRVGAALEAIQEQLQEETGLELGIHPELQHAPLAPELLLNVAQGYRQQLLQEAVEALGDFGSELSARMAALPLQDALEADAEISLTRTAPLPHPAAQLPEGVQGSLADPRVAAHWQMAGICELAVRHGWEVLEVVDAAEEAAAEAARREEQGLPAPTPEEEAAAALATSSERLLLEAMCEGDDEIMELRTGLTTPVQVYLRFRARQARRPPTSHPLTELGEMLLQEQREAVEGQQQGTLEVVEGQVVGQKAAEGQITAAAAAAAGSKPSQQIALALQQQQRQPAEEEEEAEEAEEDEDEDEGAADDDGEGKEVDPLAEYAPGPFGPVTTGPLGSGSHPSEYEWHRPPDDVVQLPLQIAAAAEVLEWAEAGAARRREEEAAAAAAQQADLVEEGKKEEKEKEADPMSASIAAVADLAAEVVLSGREALRRSEAEALVLMEMGFETGVLDIDGPTGLPLLASLGPAPDGLYRDLVVGSYGNLAASPPFRHLAPLLEGAAEEEEQEAGGEGEEAEQQQEEEGLEGVQEEEEETEEEEVAAAASPVAKRSRGRRPKAASAAAAAASPASVEEGEEQAAEEEEQDMEEEAEEEGCEECEEEDEESWQDD
ncbi:hypothetical protein Agub_g12255, partial [Astrephomene gubernaculifera]